MDSDLRLELWTLYTKIEKRLCGLRSRKILVFFTCFFFFFWLYTKELCKNLRTGFYHNLTYLSFKKQETSLIIAGGKPQIARNTFNLFKKQLTTGFDSCNLIMQETRRLWISRQLGPGESLPHKMKRKAKTSKQNHQHLYFPHPRHAMYIANEFYLNIEFYIHTNIHTQ